MGRAENKQTQTTDSLLLSEIEVAALNINVDPTPMK